MLKSPEKFVVKAKLRAAETEAQLKNTLWQRQPQVILGKHVQLVQISEFWKPREPTLSSFSPGGMEIRIHLEIPHHLILLMPCGLLALKVCAVTDEYYKDKTLHPLLFNFD